VAVDSADSLHNFTEETRMRGKFCKVRRPTYL